MKKFGCATMLAALLAATLAVVGNAQSQQL
jgi:hypothetical protein